MIKSALFVLCFPKVSTYLKMLFTPEQMVQEHDIWEKAMEQKLPAFYEGLQLMQ